MFLTCLSSGLIAVYTKKGYNKIRKSNLVIRFVSKARQRAVIDEVIDELDWMVS